MKIDKTISKNIRRYRLVNGYTLDNLATFLEIEYEKLSDFEDGVGSMSVTNLNKISALFGVELDELLSENTNSIIDKPHSQTLTDIDIRSIAEFNRIVINYIKMNRILSTHT